MQNVWLDESQARIKISRRNVSNIRYVDDTILMAESEEELKSLLVKEESEKAGLKLIQNKNKNKNTKIMASGPIISWQIEKENTETDKYNFLGLQNHYILWL